MKDEARLGAAVAFVSAGRDDAQQDEGLTGRTQTGKAAVKKSAQR